MTSTSRTARCGPACRVVWQGYGLLAVPYADSGTARTSRKVCDLGIRSAQALSSQHFGSKRSISKVDLPSVFLPAELRDRLFDVLQAQLSGFSILGVGRLDQSSMPDAGVASDAGSDVPTIEGGRYTCTGATDSETGLSAGGATGSVA